MAEAVNATGRLRLGFRSGRAEDRAREDATDAVADDSSAQDGLADFGGVYRRWGAPVYRYCLVRLGSREAAEDATSAVFLRAMNGWSGFRGGSLPAWLFAIARNVVADAAKQRPTFPLELAADRPDDRPSPEEVALASDTARTLASLLSALTVDQRQVVELRLSGLTGAEIAAVLGRSDAAVKMLQLRAMQRLRALPGLETERDG